MRGSILVWFFMTLALGRMKAGEVGLAIFIAILAGGVALVQDIISEEGRDR